jgi:hypothetical protein
MQNRNFAAPRMTYGELALEACTAVGGVLMILGVLLFILVSVLGLDGIDWILASSALLVSTALIVTSIGIGYVTASELAEPGEHLERVSETHAMQSDTGATGRDVRLAGGDVEGSAREPPSRRISARSGECDSRVGSQRAAGVH